MARHVLTELKIPAEADFVPVAKSVASRLGGKLGFSLEELDELTIAVTQACESVIDEGRHTWIKLTYAETPRGLAVDVQALAPKAPESLPAVRSAQQQLEDLQRLSHEMIRCFVDDFQTQVEAHRVRISMVKYLLS
jgi:anti-sigma regulatory factor (Ser/Thr protein kinase)